MFGNFSSNVLDKRMKKLEAYLNEVSLLINPLENPEIWDLIDLDKDTNDFLMSLQSSPEITTKRVFQGSGTSGDTKEIFRINKILELWKYGPLNITNTVKDFESEYFRKRLRLTTIDIEQLLWGDQILKGLLSYCGNDANKVGARYCIEFFIKLMKYEYNSLEAGKFINVYANTNPKIIKQMKLDKYVKEIMSQDNPGFLAVYYYLVYNTYDIKDITDLLIDKEGINLYNSWIKMKLASGYLSKISLKTTKEKCDTNESKVSSETNESEESQTEEFQKNETMINELDFEFGIIAKDTKLN